MRFKINGVEYSVTGILNTIKNALLLFFSFGVVLLAAGWMAPKLGITFVRLPSAEPQTLVYAAGLVWLLK